MSRELNIAGVMITCPGREAQLRATLADLRKFEPDLRLHVQTDENTCERRQERQERNSLTALTVGLGKFPDAEVLSVFRG